MQMSLPLLPWPLPSSHRHHHFAPSSPPPPAGMGAGIWFTSTVTFEPQNLASTQLVDTKTPNSELCMANGYSSMVFDQRIFVSFNP